LPAGQSSRSRWSRSCLQFLFLLLLSSFSLFLLLLILNISYLSPLGTPADRGSASCTVIFPSSLLAAVAIRGQACFSACQCRLAAFCGSAFDSTPEELNVVSLLLAFALRSTVNLQVDHCGSDQPGNECAHFSGGQRRRPNSPISAR